MFQKLSIASICVLALSLLGNRPCSAQACPNFEYSLFSTPVGAEPWCATAGDFNADGADDIVVGLSPFYSAGGLRLLLNAGNGVFPAVSDIAGAYSPRSLDVGDLDHDGDLDLAVSDQGQLGTNGFVNDGVRVYLNDSRGQFTTMRFTAFGPEDDAAAGLRLGDLDADGDLDVAIAVGTHQTGPFTADSRVLVYLNDGQGQLVHSGAFLAGPKPGFLVLVDLNGDQILDYATVHGGASNLSVVFGLGNGTFEGSMATYAAGIYPSGLEAGDFDGDSDVDLAVGWKYGLRVLVNQGNGTFVGGPTQTLSHYNKALAAGDFNQDGNLDLVATFATTGDVKFLAGDGSGSFAAAKAYPAGNQVYALTCGDWNGDGILDAATANSDASEARIWSSNCGSYTYCTAKTNSQGCLPVIAFTGTPSASSSAPFLITAAQLLNQVNGLLFYGYHTASTPFLGGTLCVAPPLHRTTVQNSGGSAVGIDCSGAYAFDFNAQIQSAIDLQLVVGAQVFAQYWSRDPGFSNPNNVELTDALVFQIEP